MKQLFDTMRSDPTVAKAISSLSARHKHTALYGISGSVKSAIISAAYCRDPRQTVIVASDQAAVDQYRSDLAVFLPKTPVRQLPAVDIVSFSATAKSVDLIARRMEVLNSFLRKEQAIVLVTAEAAIQKVLSRKAFEDSRLILAAGEQVQRDDILAVLVRFGYEHVDQVDSRGQFSARGGIIDLYPINRQAALRVELFGDEVDSIREFDVLTQRSTANLERAEVLPLTEPEHVQEWAAFLTYLDSSASVIFDEPARLREQMANLVKENPDLKKRVYGWNELASGVRELNAVYLSLMLRKIPSVEPNEILSITMKSIAPFHRQFDLLVNELGEWRQQKTTPVLFFSNREKALSVQNNLTGEGVPSLFAAADNAWVPGAAIVTLGALSSGFELPNAHLAVLTEKDIFGRQKKRLRQKATKDQQIAYFRDIKVGDYVVHVNHGIGKYVGVETLEVAGAHKDYLLIRYAGEDKLYVPTDQVNLLQKYIGAEGESPRLSRMGGSDWNKAKSKAKAAVADLAKDLIALYAERQTAVGYAFAPDTPWQKEFEEAFPYEETPDQLSAIAEVKADMESTRPMDRLVCGDVGFGKTEVAIRAAFKAVMSGKQVAVLVPTTVLAQQHFQTFSERFAGFGPTVDVISRFRSAREQKATLEKVAAGQVDVLIGTHRILQADVQFKDIGLLIVDEEQRFGVAQKERIKRWKANIDVLTLTATPIPRTLHMSLVGSRDMSIIETPPEDRFPIQTYVVEYQEEIIRDAIKRELKRGGQVYFVYNRIQTIDKIQRHLMEMLPDATVGVGHGQMPEELLEQVMLDFYEGRDDILLCTSIIENGLDVPNANTIIVYDADHFGLSQLYQMRGRVGRSHRMAYSYFTYRRDKVLSEAAEKRLQAIKEFAELGAGFKIAMRDLEIRGAGNLLGAQQHGHIVSVGFEMYCRLLDEAVQELKSGQPVELPADPVLEFDVDAYLTGDYIADPMHKIELYQRIAAIRTEAHIHDLVDELIDRFGEPPLPVQNLLEVARVKNLARSLGVASVLERKGHVEVLFGERPNVDVEQIMSLKQKLPSRITLYPGPPESIQIRTHKISMPIVKWIGGLLAQIAAGKGN